jgi:hypothetical protein
MRATVVTGPRSPKEAAERESEKVKAGMLDLAMEALESVRKQGAQSRPAEVREFGSLFRGLRLTIKRSDEREVNGITIPAKLQTVMFEDGVLRTSDPIVIAAIEGHRTYGRDIWDADELRLKTERLAAEGLLARVDELPADIKDALRVKLGMTDFTMPAPETTEAPSA